MAPDLNIVPASKFVQYSLQVNRSITLTELELHCIQTLSHADAIVALTKSRRNMAVLEITAIVEAVKGAKPEYVSPALKVVAPAKPKVQRVLQGRKP